MRMNKPRKTNWSPFSEFLALANWRGEAYGWARLYFEDLKIRVGTPTKGFYIITSFYPTIDQPWNTHSLEILVTQLESGRTRNANLGFIRRTLQSKDPPCGTVLRINPIFT